MLSDVLPEVSLAEDFAKTAQRFEAWWHGELIDRAVVSPGVEQEWQHNAPSEKNVHDSVEARWFDIEYQLEESIRRLENAMWLGDALPVLNPNIGPELTTTLLGAELSFGETTSWAEHCLTDPEQWDDYASQEVDFANRYWQFTEEMTKQALDRCDGRYLVGIADLHGSYDMLSGLRDPQMLCMDLLDCPDKIFAAGMQASEIYVEALERNYKLMEQAGMGSTCWTAFYHHGIAYVPSCDFWCLVSREVVEELILPTVQREMQAMDRTIFHLDGPDALRHLDFLLEMPDLNAVQWVYGAGNGPAANWIETYKRILDAGKSIQVMAETPQDALTCLEALGPKGVWCTIDQPMTNEAECRAFLHEVERLSLGH